MRIRWRGFELPGRIVIEHDPAQPNYAKFSIVPFERGYGVTVGNSLRRVLLNSLEGCAATSVKATITHTDDKGAQKTEPILHEYTAIPGVYEDMPDIVLNIKNMLLKIHVDEPINLVLEKSGEGPLTAGHAIPDPTHFEIVNKDLVIATLTGNVKLRIELTAQKGRGYNSAEDNIRPDQAIGTIPIASKFSPVTLVRYTTESARVGQRTDFDKLIMQIWTSGVITPENALVEAATILRKHFNPFVKLMELGAAGDAELAPVQAEVKVEDRQVDAQQKAFEEMMSWPVTKLDLSVRAQNCLNSENIKSIGELVQRAETDMLKIRNFGRGSLREVKKKLEELGLSFASESTVAATVATGFRA
ncbi:MAG TPA: DNA-directed RNA polymerase subunit alpha [Planctomycetota bacterium]|nr:DNA-directed RNA polymerase subunit alpha [Planctomycetota bacterium]